MYFQFAFNTQDDKSIPDGGGGRVLVVVVRVVVVVMEAVVVVVVVVVPSITMSRKPSGSIAWFTELIHLTGQAIQYLAD